jgi:RNA polymerase sigma-70 factor, ECF subfamily
MPALRGDTQQTLAPVPFATHGRREKANSTRISTTQDTTACFVTDRNKFQRIPNKMEVSTSHLAIQARTYSLRWSWISKTAEGSKDSRASSDAELAGRLKQKDEHAFMSLYDLHRSSVFRFLMHMTGSIVAAEELTQEVFVVILDAMCTGTIGQFDPRKGTLEGYLLGIARNLARAEKRRMHRLISLDNVIESPEWERLLNTMFQESRNSDLAALMASRSELRVVYRAIQDLPEHYREAVVLCGLQQKSYKDAALILQCSEGTIASRMNRAKAILASRLRRSGLNSVTGSAIVRGKEDMDARAAIRAKRNTG